MSREAAKKVPDVLTAAIASLSFYPLPTAAVFARPSRKGVYDQASFSRSTVILVLPEGAGIVVYRHSRYSHVFREEDGHY